MANLLTSEEKKVLARERGQRKLILGLGLLVALFLVAVIFNLAIWLSLSIQARAASSLGQTYHSVTNNKEAVVAEKELSRLVKLWPRQEWTELINQVIAIKPASIKINQIAGVWRDKDRTIVLAISGQAKSRQDLVNFTDKLRQEKVFSRVDLPVEYLLSTSQGQFTINLEVKNND